MSLEDAYNAVDLDTITLLLGMMIVVAYLLLSGFFAMAATTWVMARARRPVIVLAMARRDCRDFLPGERRNLPEVEARAGTQARSMPTGAAMASNVGSTATITGNPQNIIPPAQSCSLMVRLQAPRAPPMFVIAPACSKFDDFGITIAEKTLRRDLRVLGYRGGFAPSRTAEYIKIIKSMFPRSLRRLTTKGIPPPGPTHHHGF